MIYKGFVEGVDFQDNFACPYVGPKCMFGVSLAEIGSVGLDASAGYEHTPNVQAFSKQNIF